MTEHPEMNHKLIHVFTCLHVKNTPAALPGKSNSEHNKETMNETTVVDVL